MRYRTVDCCPMAATQKMSCAPLSPLAASSAGSFNNSPVNSGILPTDSPEEPLYGCASHAKSAVEKWLVHQTKVLLCTTNICRFERLNEAIRCHHYGISE